MKASELVQGESYTFPMYERKIYVYMGIVNSRHEFDNGVHVFHIPAVNGIDIGAYKLSDAHLIKSTEGKSERQLEKEMKAALTEFQLTPFLVTFTKKKERAELYYDSILSKEECNAIAEIFTKEHDLYVLGETRYNNQLQSTSLIFKERHV